MSDTNAASSFDVSDYYSIPIFIQNFNQVSYLQRQIAWLLRAGYRRIVVIDNNSTYPPLLRYYEEMVANGSFTLERRATNVGSKFALWDEHLLTRYGVSGPFVYTDSDVVPDECCPADIVAHLALHLHNNPQLFKAGLGLRIDNLPTTYAFHKHAYIWERQFWRAPVARGMFMAPIDTTFALYRPGSQFALAPAIRTGWPYLARHEPWYADSEHPSEEQLNYSAAIQATPRGHWQRAQLPEWLGRAIEGLTSSAPKLLHLGCGHEIIPGWINLDVNQHVGADIAYDLETCAEKPLPIDDDSVDGIFMSHAFQHIDRTLPMMQELYRVAKANARFVIRLPHGASDVAFEDPTHKRPCFPNSFVYFAQPAYSRADYSYRGDWRIARAKLVVDPELLKSEDEARLLQRFFSASIESETSSRRW